MAENNVVSTVIERTQSSVVVKRDAKGVKSYEVKAYAESIEEATKLAIEQSRRLDIEIDLGEE